MFTLKYALVVSASVPKNVPPNLLTRPWNEISTCFLKTSVWSQFHREIRANGIKQMLLYKLGDCYITHLDTKF